MKEGLHLLPEVASTIAQEVEWLFLSLVLFSVALLSLLSFLVIRYAVKYRAGTAADRSHRLKRTSPLEMTWTSAAIIIAFGLFGWGAVLYKQRGNPPPDAIHIIGIGKQWMWKFQHGGGQREINELHVPVGRAVVLELGSQDVIHSFYVPAFRIKQDAVPGMTTRLWFEAIRPGRFHLFCSEYCGTQHSRMRGSIVAMQQERFAEWLAARQENESLAAQGAKLFRALGCSGCHDHSPNVRAPPLEGVFGRPVALADGGTVIADTRYVRDSILLPEKHVAAGYEPIMPSYSGLIDEEELLKVIAYIRSLSAPEERR